jgi:hypothetical protein
LNDGAGPNPDPNIGSVHWIQLASRPGTDHIALAYVDAGRDLVVIEWDGSQWLTATAATLELNVRAHTTNTTVNRGIMAGVILLGVAGTVWSTRRHYGWKRVQTRMATAWLGLILIQASLGAATIWTNKAADIATAHVAVGALSLVTGAALALIAGRGVGAKAPEGHASSNSYSLPGRQVNVSA